MNAVRLPEGHALRPPSFKDAQAVADVVAATEVADAGKSDMTAEEVLSYWQSMNYAEESVVVVEQEGRIVAAADVLNRSFASVSVYGFVHPDSQGRRIGRSLVEWGECWTRDRMDRARPDARVVVQHYRHSSNQAARELFEGLGYAPVRANYSMEIELDGVPAQPEWPAGVSVRGFVSGQDGRATYEAHEDAFRDVWGRSQLTFDDFVARTLVDAFDPDLWFLAEEGGAIAGICLCKVFGEHCTIDSVGVRRGWRNRGIGLAMLRHAFGVVYQRGVHNAWLNVDTESLTGATRLYERAGMHVTNTYIMHQKELRPGVDLGQRASEE